MKTVLLCYWLKRHFERGSLFLFCLWNEMVTTYYALSTVVSVRLLAEAFGWTASNLHLGHVQLSPGSTSEAGRVTMCIRWRSWSIWENWTPEFIETGSVAVRSGYCSCHWDVNRKKVTTIKLKLYIEDGRKKQRTRERIK
jgi:hypothetical protein